MLLSLLVSITGSGLALSIVSRRKIGWTRAVAGGVVLGSVGISGMHYIGMAAMRLQGMHHYSPALVTLSVASGILVSLAAVTPAVLFPEDIARHGFPRYASVVIRGSANPVMHYGHGRRHLYALLGVAERIARCAYFTHCNRWH